MPRSPIPREFTMTRGFLILSTAIAALAWAAAAPATEPAYDEAVRPFIAKHCAGCHGPEVQESELRLDLLPEELASPGVRKTWAKVLDKLRAGKMPPRKQPRPAAGDIAAVVAWIDASLRREASRQRSEGRVVLRRLNRVQYENTIRDLLAIDVDLKDLLPEDTAAHGFDTVAEALKISPVLMESYLDAADAALDAAIASKPQPATKAKRYSFHDEQMVVRNPRLYLVRDDEVVLFNPGPRAVPLLGFRPSERGRYRFRISASSYQTDRPMTMAVYGGDIAGREGAAHLIGYFDVPPNRPAVVTFEDRLGPPKETIKIVPYGLGNGIYSGGSAEDYRGPGLAVQWVEIEGPLGGEWPPESHHRLFDDLLVRPVPGEGATALEVFTERPREDAERLLRRFALRAFRRPVDDDLVHSFVRLVWDRLDAGYRFEEAMRVGFKAVLCAPEFLFFLERPGRLDDYALASRLAYFLWSSLPDDALLEHARASDLARPEVLRSETERLLKDRRAHRFTADFLGQWLDLRQIDDTTPDPRLYPQFDELLQVSMVRETELFFEELLAHDLSVRNVIDSDFTMINARLARHYGIDGVVGQEFRKVHLPSQSHRGGVLTQASVLKVTANGTNTSPVRRGVWVLDNILGAPPDPPPPNVPAIEPDVQGTTTVRAQLAAHRNVAACAHCHVAIDPPGFALESYDVIGSWRDSYRALDDRSRAAALPQGDRINPARIQQLVQRLDTNKDGTVEKAEVPRQGADLFRRLLSLGDSDHDDKVDRAELEALVARLKAQAPTPGKRAQAEPASGRNRFSRQGPPIDAGDVLPDGRRFRNTEEFKQLLLADIDQVVGCLAEKLLVYATGAAVDSADSGAVAEIGKRIADRDFGLRSLVHEVVQSELFRVK